MNYLRNMLSPNEIRNRIPFWYWLVYDAILLPFLIYSAIADSAWYAIPIPLVLVAAFFDVNEAIVKYGN